MESFEIDEDLENNIKLLNKELADLKNERIKSEKIEIMFNKRYKVLNIQKELSDLKKRNQIKSLEKKKIIRINMFNDKNILKEKKLKEEQELEEQKMKNFALKNKINKSLEWRKRNFSEKNRKEANKIKQEKNKRKKSVDEQNEKNFNEKKQMHDIAKINIMKLEEKKHNGKIMKNLILKNELHKQTEKEIEKIGKINKLYRNDEDINKILQKYPNNDKLLKKK